AATTSSRRLAPPSSPSSAAAGASSSAPSIASPESSMPDFKRAIERRLAGLALAPTRHAEIVLELSQHLQDRYDDLRAAGAPDVAATCDSIAELAFLSRQLAAIERYTPEPIDHGRGGRSLMDVTLAGPPIGRAH